MSFHMTHYCVGITGSTKVFHICLEWRRSVDSEATALKSNGAPKRSSPVKVKLREFKR